MYACVEPAGVAGRTCDVSFPRKRKRAHFLFTHFFFLDTENISTFALSIAAMFSVTTYLCDLDCKIM